MAARLERAFARARRMLAGPLIASVAECGNSSLGAARSPHPATGDHASVITVAGPGVGPAAAAGGGAAAVLWLGRPTRVQRMRVLIALGGNAMTGPDGSAAPEDQDRAVGVAMQRVADLVAAGTDVVLTHGNGPQVGNLLVKNELAAHVVPPVPLDWCGAQTQGTIGFLILDSLDKALADRGVDRPYGDRGHPHPRRRRRPRLPPPDQAGRPLPAGGPRPRALIEHGQTWEDRGEKGWRRVVASPEPLEIARRRHRSRPWPTPGTSSSAPAAAASRWCATPDGTLRGVEAVIDKDLAAALLARAVRRRGAGDRDRRRARRARLRHRRRAAARPGHGRRDARDRAASRSSPAAAWARRSRPRVRFVEYGGRRAPSSRRWR